MKQRNYVGGEVKNLLKHPPSQGREGHCAEYGVYLTFRILSLFSFSDVYENAKRQLICFR